MRPPHFFFLPVCMFCFVCHAAKKMRRLSSRFTFYQNQKTNKHQPAAAAVSATQETQSTLHVDAIRNLKRITVSSSRAQQSSSRLLYICTNQIKRTVIGLIYLIVIVVLLLRLVVQVFPLTFLNNVPTGNGNACIETKGESKNSKSTKPEYCFAKGPKVALWREFCDEYFPDQNLIRTESRLLQRQYKRAVNITIKTLRGTNIQFVKFRDITVDEIKRKVAADLGFSVDEMRLVFDHKMLEDGKLLGSYGIKQNSTIFADALDLQRNWVVLSDSFSQFLQDVLIDIHTYIFALFFFSSWINVYKYLLRILKCRMRAVPQRSQAVHKQINANISIKDTPAQFNPHKCVRIRYTSSLEILLTQSSNISPNNTTITTT